MINAAGAPPTLTTSDGRIFIPQMTLDPGQDNLGIPGYVFGQFPTPSYDETGSGTLTHRMVIVRDPGTPAPEEVQQHAGYLDITDQQGLNGFIQSQGDVLQILLARHESVHGAFPSDPNRGPGQILLQLFTRFVHHAAAVIGRSEATESSSSEESRASTSNQ